MTMTAIDIHAPDFCRRFTLAFLAQKHAEIAYQQAADACFDAGEDAMAARRLAVAWRKLVEAQGELSWCEELIENSARLEVELRKVSP